MLCHGRIRPTGQGPVGRGGLRHAAVSPADIVVGSGNYSPTVQDLDKAIEFYSLLGLTIPPAAAPGPRPVSTGPALLVSAGGFRHR